MIMQGPLVWGPRLAGARGLPFQLEAGSKAGEGLLRKFWPATTVRRRQTETQSRILTSGCCSPHSAIGGARRHKSPAFACLLRHADIMTLCTWARTCSRVMPAVSVVWEKHVVGDWEGVTAQSYLYLLR